MTGKRLLCFRGAPSATANTGNMQILSCSKQTHTPRCQVYGEKHLACYLHHFCSSCSRSQTPRPVFPFLVQHAVTLLWRCQEAQAWLSSVPGPRPAARHGRGEGAILGQGLAGKVWARHNPAAGLQTIKAR